MLKTGNFINVYLEQRPIEKKCNKKKKFSDYCAFDILWKDVFCLSFQSN